MSLPLELIRVGERLRAVDPATVSNLAVAISESGFFGTVLVRPIPGDEGETCYELVVGAHRYAAMQQLGRPTIPCTIRILTDDEAIQLEIDENMVRRGLSPLERAEMVAARFTVWRRRFPDRVTSEGVAAKPKRGRPGKAAKFAEFIGGAPQAMGFTAETAADVGLSKRTIEAAWTTVNGLPAHTRLRLRSTWIAKNEGVLRQLAGIADETEQAAVIDVLLSGKTKSVSDAVAYAAGNAPSKGVQTPVDEAVKAFKTLWGKASPSAREAILHDLAGRSLPKGWTLSAPEADLG